MLVSQETINAIYEIVGESFKANRILDRAVSVLNTKFACNNASGKIHKDLAHLYPLLADRFGEILETYNIPVEYAATPFANQDYESVEQIIYDINDVAVDYQSYVMGVAKIAFENNDLHAYVEILDILEDVNKTVAATILLKDKIGLYKDNIVAFDNHIDKFWTLGSDLDD